jgi:hypothetical protein
LRDEPKFAPPRAYFLKILTIVFRYGAQHDPDQQARCRSTATDIWKLALTARSPTWPELGANMSRGDPDAPTDALSLHLASGAEESRERALLR